MGEEVVPAFRRNGKKPSCEPCRRSKYSCDHVTPTCGRCVRRGMSEKCSYHPAPMKGLTPRVAKSHAQSNPPKRHSRSESQARSSVFSAPHRAETPMDEHLLTSSAAQQAWVVPPRQRETPTASSDASPDNATRHRERSSSARLTLQEHGFLGSTSYNAVFTDNIEHIDLDPEGPETTASTSRSDKLHAQITAAQKKPHRLKDAVTVLKFLSKFPDLVNIVDKWISFDKTVSVIGLWVDPCRDDIRTMLWETGVLKSDETMASVAEQLFQNSEEPIATGPESKFKDFMNDYTGSKMRWETLGVFFTAVGLCLNCMRSDDAMIDFVGHREEDKQNLMFQILEVSNACVAFCDDAGQSSDLGLWLSLENCIYNSQVLGDAHYVVWRKVGDLSTAIFVRGLHQEGSKSSAPFWLKELRRRGLGTAYAMDKMLCTFVGRPPRISQRYCTILIPLDLEHHQLGLEGAALDAALSTIDPITGWNLDVKDRKSSYSRTFVMCAQLREEVLELCLGPPQDGQVEKAHDVIKRNQSLHTSLPMYMQHLPDMWMTREATPSFMAAQAYLDFLYNEFMLRRMLVRRQLENPTELMQVARKILIVVTEARNIRSSLTHNAACIAWIVVLYGLPAAGVLALNLLQEKTGVVKPFPRVQVIQDLSVFISCLKWAHSPGDGNYQLTEQARKTLQRILDKVLSADFQQAPERTQPLLTPNSTDVSDEFMYDFSGWPNTADFDPDFWMNLPIPTQ